LCLRERELSAWIVRIPKYSDFNHPRHKFLEQFESFACYLRIETGDIPTRPGKAGNKSKAH